MSSAEGFTNWMEQLRRGDTAAAQRLWEDYFERLTRLARQELAGAPRRAVDEEDTVLAALHSFCRGVRQGRFPKLDDRDDLWQVLVVLTARKASKQAKH